MHAGIVLREDPALFGELFAELANAYMEQALFADALGIYSVLLGGVQVSPTRPCVQAPFAMAICRSLSRLPCKQVYATSDLGDSRKLRASLDGVRTTTQIPSTGLLIGVRTVVSVNPELRDGKMRLAEVYEMQGEPAKALELVRESRPALHNAGLRCSSHKTQSLIPDARAHQGNQNRSSGDRSTIGPTKRNVASSVKSGCGVRAQRKRSSRMCSSTLTNSRAWISKTKSGSRGGSRKSVWWSMILGNAGSCSLSIVYVHPRRAGVTHR
jgi:hypothetical protein